MNAFITGSRVYGKPTPSSDIDLVILVDEQTSTRLQLMARETDEQKPLAIRFGRLNLIICTDEAEFAVWKVGTCQMVRQKIKDGKKFDKTEAKAVFDLLRESLGMEDGYSPHEKE